MTGAGTRIVVAVVAITALVIGCADRQTDRKRAAGGVPSGARDVPVPAITEPNGKRPDSDAWRRLWRETPGTPGNRCIDVGTRRDVRSGDFVVGSFAAFIRGWDGTYQTSKLYYIPAYPVDGQQLEVVATHVDGGAQRQEMLTFGGFAWTIGSTIPFYASGTFLPVRGHWRLTATAGENWGCFELRL